jgi:hypothetical protein
VARFSNEGIPCGAACVDDGGVTLEDTVAEVVLAQELPDVLHRVQFGRIGRRMKEADVFWDPQLALSQRVAPPHREWHQFSCFLLIAQSIEHGANRFCNAFD